MNVAALLLAVAAIIFVPLANYISTARKMSGRINTSDAADLWEESRAIREDYRDRLGQATERTMALERRVAELERANDELAHENLLLQHRVDLLERENETLKETVEALERQIGKSADV